MKIVSAAEMRQIDRVTSERFGVPSLTLMENAGSAVARFILSDYPQAQRISVICGKGNNGGDGFVVARRLAEAGRVVRVLLLCGPEELRGDAAAMFQKLTVLPLLVGDAGALDSADAAPIFAADLMVDAILGTGFRPPASALYGAAIRKMNDSAALIIAVDIPSVADADAMQPESGTMARAHAIVTFTAPRLAHVFAGLTAGPTVIAPIGSPRAAIVSKLGLHLSTPEDFAPLLAPRQRDANKGSYGHVLVIGGSVGKAGAAAMAGFSALRSGAGLSTVATARSVLATVAGFHPEVMTESLEETEDGTISLRTIESGRMASLLERKTVLAIGPGISRHRETAEFVRRLVQKCDTPLVLDADALNAFEGTAGDLNGRGRSLVITPHPGEMSRLTGLSVTEIQGNRVKVAREFAREHELVVVLKGHRTLIASPDGTVWVNSTGNPGMATGGTGDVLTGIVAGLIAQHPQRLLEATAVAVYLHGLAGDLACEEIGEQSLVATDLVRFLTKAFSRAGGGGDSDVRIHA
jgi:ADP-dependent NAD(P)H-hydrate dehydratase / NAD(P)H-hydrate epimerase